MRLGLRQRAATERLSFRAVHDHFRNTLMTAAEERSSRQGFDAATGELEWVLHERAVLLAEVNRIRAEIGGDPVDADAIEDVERGALGHVDYVTKFALYCAELALERRPRPVSG